MLRLGIPRRLGPAIAVAAAVLAIGAAPAAAAKRVSFYAWVGGTAPYETLWGVSVDAAGSATLLRVTPQGPSKPQRIGRLRLTGATLATVRTAARRLLTAPTVTPAPANGPASHDYALAVVTVGGRTHAVIAVDRDQPGLESLLVAVDDAVVAARASHAGAAQGSAPTPQFGQFRHDLAPDVAPCPPGQHATSISKVIPLQDAARVPGMVQLTSKGGFGGDVVAVDVNYRDVGPRPIRIGVNLEVTEPADRPGIARTMEQRIEQRLAGLTTSNGTPVTFDVNLRVRAPGDPPTPCFHEVLVSTDPNVHPVTGGPAGDPAGGGVWNADDYNGYPADFVWTHEFLHAVGLPDAYVVYFKTKGGEDIRLPTTSWNRAEQEAFVRSLGKDPTGGQALRRVLPGHEKDIMAGGNAAPDAKLLPSDLDLLAGRADSVDVHADPGTLLANKDAEDQNLGIGAGFDLVARPGAPGHADGMVGYCIDLHKHSPATGDVYDVLGPAAAQGGTAMEALQRLLEASAHAQSAPLDAAPGAQLAVWVISDNSDFTTEESDALLAQAGVTPGTTFDAPHFTSPNAGSPSTGALAPGAAGVLPETPLVETPPPPAPPVVAQLTRARARYARRRLSVQATVGAADTSVTATLRRRRDGVVRRFKARPAVVGVPLLVYATPRLKPGRYVVVLRGDFGRATARFTVKRSRG